MYKKGDVVKVWSMQSFFGGGFLNGVIAIVRQNQISNTVLLIVSRRIELKIMNSKKQNISIHSLDTSYEVYEQQTELIKNASLEDGEKVEEFLILNNKIREYERNFLKSEEFVYVPSHYAPEFFIDENYVIQLNKNLLQYPEAFI